MGELPQPSIELASNLHAQKSANCSKWCELMKRTVSETGKFSFTSKETLIPGEGENYSVESTFTIH